MTIVELGAGRPVSAGPLGWHGVSGLPALQTHSYGAEWRIIFDAPPPAGDDVSQLVVAEGWVLGALGRNPWGRVVPSGFDRAYASAAAARGHWDRAEITCGFTQEERRRWAAAMLRISGAWISPKSGRFVPLSPAPSGHRHYWEIAALLGMDVADRCVSLPSWEEQAWNMAHSARLCGAEGMEPWWSGRYPL